MSANNVDFDDLPSRRGTGSIKWDRHPGYAPYWVADMDFTSPDCVQEALRRRVDHGVFGYAQPHAELVDALQHYLANRHDVDVAPSAIVHLPGMVPALSLTCRAFVQPGEQVMISSPVYYPFFHVAADAGAELIDVPHRLESTTWRFDWEAMESAVSSRTRVLILCNPQNPLGRVFSADEILQLAEFCERHQLILVADEIHCDLVLETEQPHFSSLRLPEPLRERLITLMSPSKTYNIAGLGYAFAVIENDDLRMRFNKARGCTLPEINLLAMVAADAAYRDGEPWRRRLIDYLRGNRDVLANFIRTEMPMLAIQEHAATYLYWIDCTGLGVPSPFQFFSDEANVFLTDGKPFGSGRHVRFNFGCPRAHMIAGLQAMRQAIERTSR